MYVIFMSNYFYTDASGWKQGPVTQQQLKELAASGGIDPHTPVETDGGYYPLALRSRSMIWKSIAELIGLLQ